MTQPVKHMISLKGRETKLSGAWTECYRHNVAALPLVRADARKRLKDGEFFEVKILKVEMVTNAVVETLFRQSQKTS